MNCPRCGNTCGDGQDVCNACRQSQAREPDEQLVATWECVVTERDGDLVWCDAYRLGEPDEREFWELEVPGNKWDEGVAFYVVRPRNLPPQQFE